MVSQSTFVWTSWDKEMFKTQSRNTEDKLSKSCFEFPVSQCPPHLSFCNYVSRRYFIWETGVLMEMLACNWIFKNGIHCSSLLRDSVVSHKAHFVPHTDRFCYHNLESQARDKKIITSSMQIIPIRWWGKFSLVLYLRPDGHGRLYESWEKVDIEYHVSDKLLFIPKAAGHIKGWM